MKSDSFPPIMSQEQIDYLDDLRSRKDCWPSGWWVFPAAVISTIVVIALVVS